MKFKINKSVLEKFPDIVEVVPVIVGFDASKGGDEVLGKLREVEKRVLDKLGGRDWQVGSDFKPYVETFLKFGANSAWLPSHAALTARVMEGKQIPNINPVVNFYNSYSLENSIPFGGENLSNVVGDMELTIADGEEEWWGMGEKKNKPAVAGELVWRDKQSITCRAWNWRQCDRTKLTEETKNGYFIMDGFESNKEKLIEVAKKFTDEFCRLFGGKAEILILDKDNPESEVKFDSRNENISEGNSVITKEIVKKPERVLPTQGTTTYQLMEWVNEALEKKIDLALISIERPSNSQFGDYTTNVAMLLARELKQSPIEIAKELKEKLEKIIDKNIVEKIEVAGSGYINFYLKPEYLIQIVENPELTKHGRGRTVVVDYSAPNIAKPFGIGHLRSTNIGQAVYNIYKALGWKCVGDNHLGDWGTQFGKMITAIKKAEMEDARFKIYEEGREFETEKLTIADLEKLYVAFHQAAESDPGLVDEGREWFARLEKKDPEARKLWQMCVDISMREFARVYDLLGVKIDFAHGEAFYEDMLPEIIEAVIDKRITKESSGATIVEFENMPPAMLRKGDGASTYFARDMATVKYRVDNWKPNLCIYEVGSEHKLHFQQVFGAAEMMGWVKPGQLYHLPHGLIRWASGKFSTRKGDTIHLEDIINKAMEGAGAVAEGSQVSKELTAEEKERMIKAVAIGAIKFTDLKSDPRKDVIFDWERMMDLTGDSGPYLQYTYARCQSVLNKTQITNYKLQITSFKDEETSLLRELAKLEEKVVEAAERYNPSVVAEYLISVARKYNEFYGKYRIIGQPEEKQRVWLTMNTAKILKFGLGLLGIETVEKM